MNVEVVEERMLFDEVVPLNADRIAPSAFSAKQ
jgi:hypothetical protein